MKYVKMLLVGAVATSSLLFAETSTLELERRSPSVGLQVGANFDSATTPSQVSNDTYTGFTIGAVMDFPLAPNISISPELNYARRGLNLVNVAGAQANVLYHSLEVPVFAKVSLGEVVRPYLFVGPMAVWNVSTEVRGSLGGTTASTTFNPRTFDLAFAGGIGLDAGPFFANARYALGVIDISENSADWRSRGFKILAGLKI